MKTTQTIFLATLLLLVAACDKPENSSKSCVCDDPAQTDLSTRSEGSEADAFFVTDDDLSAYVKYKSLLLKREMIVRSIDPITLESEEPLLYIIRYDDGWDLLAADKRATLPLSSSPSGDLELDPLNPMTTWIYCLAEDVLITRNSPEKEAANPEITEYNINQWKAITADESLFRSILEDCFPVEQTRDPIPPWPPVPYPGHYELVDVAQTPIVVNFVQHLIPTSWEQSGGYYNAFLPFKTDDSGNRVSAGCTAIACAQVAYFFNSTWEWVVDAPTAGYCYGDFTNPDWDQTDYSPTAWSYMDSLGTHYYVGLLIASIARESSTTFTNRGSFASFYGGQAALNHYEVGSSYVLDYSDTTIQNSLFNHSQPVIIGARASLTDTVGHAFIIDGYCRKSIETCYEYEWVWENYDHNLSYPKIPNQYEYSYSSPVFTDYYMNWGWNPAYNSIPFAVSGDWIMNVPNNTPHNYTFERQMVYDFYFIGN